MSQNYTYFCQISKNTPLFDVPQNLSNEFTCAMRWKRLKIAALEEHNPRKGNGSTGEASEQTQGGVAKARGEDVRGKSAPGVIDRQQMENLRGEHGWHV